MTEADTGGVKDVLCKILRKRKEMRKIVKAVQPLSLWRQSKSSCPSRTWWFDDERGRAEHLESSCKENNNSKGGISLSIFSRHEKLVQKVQERRMPFTRSADSPKNARFFSFVRKRWRTLSMAKGFSRRWSRRSSVESRCLLRWMSRWLEDEKHRSSGAREY